MKQWYALYVSLYHFDYHSVVSFKALFNRWRYWLENPNWVSYKPATQWCVCHLHFGCNEIDSLSGLIGCHRPLLVRKYDDVPGIPYKTSSQFSKTQVKYLPLCRKPSGTTNFRTSSCILVQSPAWRCTVHILEYIQVGKTRTICICAISIRCLIYLLISQRTSSSGISLYTWKAITIFAQCLHLKC